MGRLDYHRTVVGYHGCDESLVRSVLINGKKLKPSEKSYDWLGKGIYFWEHGPQRAYEWAVWRSQNPIKSSDSQITKPAVLGAYLNLGNCFDLLDTLNTKLLADFYPKYRETCEAKGVQIPRNEAARNSESSDLVLRYLDCAVVNWCLEIFEKEAGIVYDSVRCVFSEGTPAFEGSKIMLKSHVQIAIRKPENSIIGFFKPNLDIPL